MSDREPRIMTGRTRESLREDRWYALLATTRLLGAAVAITLLAVHSVTSYDPELMVLTAAVTTLSLYAFGHSESLRASTPAWMVDTATAMALVLLSKDWRSPFYLYSLTALVLPATTLPRLRALAWSALFIAGYVAVAILTRKLPVTTLDSPVRFEIAATHLTMPLLVTLALTHAAGLLDSLRQARAESERLVLEAERRRIAWELHDSAKQRVHAAHLMLTAMTGRNADGGDPILDAALAELRGATADMETSVAELREPLDGRPLGELLRERATELEAAGPMTITISGDLPALGPQVSAHAFRVASEALTNAVRHSGGESVSIALEVADDGRARIVVSDDGCGMPRETRPSSSGLRSMHARAETIGAELDISPNDGGPGTTVALTLPRQGVSR